MRRRALTALVAGVLGLGGALGIAACGDDDEDTDIAPVEIDDTTTTEATTEETTTEETTTEQTQTESGGYGY